MYELIPGTPSSLIQVRLVHKILSHIPECIALSYEWGARTRDFEIICDNATLMVTENIVKALKRLRGFHGRASDHKPDSMRFDVSGRILFWIDAIRINQDNLN
ncbi:hypothetical protein BOTNAR_0360g00040 [Botryotinia narcissicola]|uniref:Heterokaryon incompatibility domain-containing protein n=1 Tax=Botryotinia narcissicola TaxID=278944 RepID=A0A4Z1I2V3_9HELO|nr:hypothetical protein BOTNAR_0360g00040 [Botryotinia narcissicola]